MKTITLDEDAYRILAALKASGRDSFSQVIKRHFRRSGRLSESAGAWSDVTEDEVRALRRETVEAFQRSRRRK